MVMLQFNGAEQDAIRRLYQRFILRTSPILRDCDSVSMSQTELRRWVEEVSTIMKYAPSLQSNDLTTLYDVLKNAEQATDTSYATAEGLITLVFSYESAETLTHVFNVCTMTDTLADIADKLKLLKPPFSVSLSGLDILTVRSKVVTYADTSKNPASVMAASRLLGQIDGTLRCAKIFFNSPAPAIPPLSPPKDSRGVPLDRPQAEDLAIHLSEAILKVYTVYLGFHRANVSYRATELKAMLNQLRTIRKSLATALDD